MLKNIIILYIYAFFVFNSYTMENNTLSFEEQLAQATHTVLYNLHVRAVTYKKTKKLAQYKQTLQSIAQGCSINLTHKSNNIFNKHEFIGIRSKLQHYYLYAQFKLSSLQSDKQALKLLRKTRRRVKKWKRNNKYQYVSEYEEKINSRLKSLRLISKKRYRLI